MKTIKYEIATGISEGKHVGEFEVEDSATDDEIEELVLQELWNYISYSWEAVE
jgi:hypothetical protein